MVVKAFFPAEYSVLVSAFLRCISDTPRINEDVIAKDMQLNANQVATMLTTLAQSKLISDDIVEVLVRSP